MTGCSNDSVMLRLFGQPRVAPRMRISILVILAASLSTLACGPRNSDKLDDNELATAEGGVGNSSAVAGSDSRCSARATQEELKRQLFTRAAEIRGSNADNYARIAGFALLQVDGAAPVAETSSAALAECRGRATLRLPAGLRVAGGRTALTGDIDYSVATGAGGGAVTLGQSDPITVPLATLTQNRAAPLRPAPAPAGQTDPLAPAPQAPPQSQPSAPPPAPAAAPVPSAAARPSFDCRRARTVGERAVCDSPSLAALDRDMAARYRSAVANGGPEERRLLAQTRDRFLGFRDRCRNDACVADTYRGRMREIDDIVAGRWQPPR